MRERTEECRHAGYRSHMSIPVTTHLATIGCAGWSLTRDVMDRFPAEGSHLERYAAVGA